jgi:hypothetical protein
MLRHLKRLLPDRDVPMRVWRGPFRGATVVMNPQASLRKAFGLYEHELNAWLERALGRVRRVIDVGANDGYFTFGCAAALRRRGVAADIIAFEPQNQHVTALRAAAAGHHDPRIRVIIEQSLVGAHAQSGMTTLDALDVPDRVNTLIKIDVEGAELDVVDGAQTWLHPSNLFVIEVHQRPFLDALAGRFMARGLELVQIDQRPLPVLGRDVRDADNWWMVSKLPA